MDRIATGIVGAGALGCAVACELLKRGREDVFLFERSQYLADGQSGRNSGVIHAGIYYKEGSLKARLCVEGNRLMYEFCTDNDVPCVRTGKLVVATNEEEEQKIEQLFERGGRNGAEGLRMVGREEIRRLEPNVDARSALYAPTSGSVDAASYVKALARIARSSGAQVLMQAQVTSIEPEGDCFVLEVARPNGSSERVEAGTLVNCAGLNSDRLARMVNPCWQHALAPMRGEYCKFNRARRPDIGMKGLNVYPAPGTVRVGDADVDVVGIHLTPTFSPSPGRTAGIGDIVIVGPHFVPVADREDYESNRSPVDFFHGRVRRFFPNLEPGDMELDFAGIMANPGGTKDWVIERDRAHPNCIQLVGMDSPALTSSLAIARVVADMLERPA